MYLDYLEIELENLKKKTQNIENQQNEAIEQENFEEAEQLEIILKQHYESVKRPLFIMMIFSIMNINHKDSFP